MKYKLVSAVMIVVGLGAAAGFAWAGVARAADIRTSQRPALQAHETINSSLYAAGETVNIAGTVKGDVFCGGRDIDVTGTVEGDVICGGQNVKIAGRVMGDVRVGGQNVTVTASVNGSLTMFGERLTLEKESRVERDVTLAGSNASLKGHIGRDVLGSAGSIVVAGHIARNVDAETSILTLDPTARIGGTLQYQAPSAAQVADGAVVTGETKYTPKTPDQADTAAVYFWSTVFGFISMLVVGLAFLMIAPRAVEGAGQTVRSRLTLSFAVGAATLIVVPVAAILLCVSLYGLPLGMMALFTWVVALIAAVPVAAYGIGSLIVERFQWSPSLRGFASLVIGLAVITLSGLIPVFGAPIIFMAVVCGLGALVLCLVAARRAPAPIAKSTKITKKAK